MSAQHSTEHEPIETAAARWVARRDAGFSAKEQAEFDAWVSADPRHLSALEHYARTWSTLDGPVSMGTSVLGEMSRRARRRLRRRFLAGGALAVVVALVFLRWPEAVPAPDAPPGVANILQPERRVLRDNSAVELKPGAEIDVQYDDALRRVTLLRGEAHFQVAKSAHRPFVVVAGGVEVRAVGTAFAVQLGASDVGVLVTEGRVDVRREPMWPGGAEPKPTAAERFDPGGGLFLDAGQRVVVSLAPGSVPPAVVEVPGKEMSERLAWRAPRLEFSGMRLAEALALLNRSSAPEGADPPPRLTLDPASIGLADEPVSGLFRADNIESFVRVLELSLGVEAERRGSEIVLRRAR